MRVLIIRVGDFISGAEKYNINLLESIDQKRYEVIFFTNLLKLKEILTTLGINSKVIYPQIPELGTKRQFLRHILKIPLYVNYMLKEIKKLEGKNKIDIIIFQSMTEKILLTKILRCMGYKIYWIEHGPLFRTPRFMLIKYLYKLNSKHVNKILAVSKDTKSDLLSAGLKDSLVDVSYININTDYFKPDGKVRKLFRYQYIKDGKTCIIGYLGNVNQEKGINRFVQLAINLLQVSPNYFFVIVGDGVGLMSAKELTEKYKSNFYFSGFVDDVRPYINAMDIMLLPTEHEEGISLAILEAMAMEKCVITRKIGGNSEIINDRKDGILYRKENELVDIIRKLKKGDIETYGRLARKKIINMFSSPNFDAMFT